MDDTPQILPIVTASGDARSRGEQYGRQARERIATCLDIYLGGWLGDGATQADRDRIFTRAEEFLTQIDQSFPEMAVEIEGIAAGAGQPVEAIAALNARTEILFGQTPRGGCTAAALLPPSTNGDVVLGQNWDWRRACGASAIVLRAYPDSGPAFLTIVEAGMLARAGFNDTGLGVCGTFVSTSKDGAGQGLPITAIRRALLTSRSLPEAIGHALRLPRVFSSSHLLAAEAGEAINLEITPDDAYAAYPDDAGLLTHANHFVAGAGFVRDTGRLVFPDSLLRDRRLRHLLAGMAGPLDTQALGQALCDHSGYPHSICRHSAGHGDDPAEVVTLLSAVMDLTRRKLHLSSGAPCATPRVEIGLGPPDAAARAAE